MNYDETKEIDELILRFNEIRRKGYIKSINSSSSGIGLTFENELGISKNEFMGPDFKGIELKTHLAYSKENIVLFSVHPSNETYEIKRLVNQYGKKNKNDGKSLYLNLNSKNYVVLNSNKFKLKIDEKEEKIFLEIFDTCGNIIEKKIYWNYCIIWSTLIQKLNCMALIKVWPTKRNNIDYYKYYYLNVYYLKVNANIYNLFKKNILQIKINIDSYAYGNKKGKIHDHGCGIMINEANLKYLFNKLF